MNEQKDNFDQFGEFLVFLAETNAFNEYLEETLKERGSIESVDKMLSRSGPKHFLMNSFTWADSSQGAGFWCDLDDGWEECLFLKQKVIEEREGLSLESQAVQPGIETTNHGNETVHVNKSDQLNVELNSLEEIEDFFAKNPNFEPDDMIMEDECHDCQCDAVTLPKSSLMSRIKGFFKR